MTPDEFAKLAKRVLRELGQEVRERSLQSFIGPRTGPGDAKRRLELKRVRIEQFSRGLIQVSVRFQDTDRYICVFSINETDYGPYGSYTYREEYLDAAAELQSLILLDLLAEAAQDA